MQRDKAFCLQITKIFHFNILNSNFQSIIPLKYFSPLMDPPNFQKKEVDVEIIFSIDLKFLFLSNFTALLNQIIISIFIK